MKQPMQPETISGQYMMWDISAASFIDALWPQKLIVFGNHYQIRAASNHYVITLHYSLILVFGTIDPNPRLII